MFDIERVFDPSCAGAMDRKHKESYIVPKQERVVSLWLFTGSKSGFDIVSKITPTATDMKFEGRYNS